MRHPHLVVEAMDEQALWRRLETCQWHIHCYLVYGSWTYGDAMRDLEQARAIVAELKARLTQMRFEA